MHKLKNKNNLQQQIVMIKYKYNKFMKVRKIMKKLKQYKNFIMITISVIFIAIAAIVCFLPQNNIKNSQTTETIVLANMDEDAQVLDISSETLDSELKENEQIKEEEKENKENKNSNNSSNTGYYIKVNYTANVVTIYGKDDSGNCTKPIKAMICSTGSATPKSGVYTIKTKWTWGLLFGNVYGHYVTKIVGNILFHSVPYLSNDPSTLEYWEYDKLGTSASMGCVRLTVADAQWIFNTMPSGTPVEFYSDSNPGPLGKPSAQKISGNTECRGWDPTDPDANNPWHNVKEKVEEPKVVETPATPTQATPNNNPNNNNNPSSSGNQETGSEEDTQKDKEPGTELDENTGNSNTTGKENNSGSQANTTTNNTSTDTPSIPDDTEKPSDSTPQESQEKLEETSIPVTPIEDNKD